MTDDNYKNIETLLKIFTFDKKKDLKKYCRKIVIHNRAFADIIVASKLGKLPFLHESYFGDFMPEELILTDADHKAISSNGVGKLKPNAKKAVNKISQSFEKRKHSCGHLFLAYDLREWHFFLF